MKKTFFLTVCLIMASLSAFGESLPSIMLLHNGGITMFSSDKMQDAINAAVKGDTIYLSDGNFNGHFTIDKEVCIIGAGDSRLNNITLSIDGTPTLTARLLDAVSCETLTIEKPVNNLILRKCVVYTLTYYDDRWSTNGTVKNLFIDRCRIYTYYGALFSGEVVNTYISEFHNSGACKFINCLIDTNYYSKDESTSDDTKGSIDLINTIVRIGRYDSQLYHFHNCKLINTRYPENFRFDDTSIVQDCYTGGEFSTYRYEGADYYTISPDWLKENNYLGTDGTIIGMFGGTTPFTLDPNVPKVTESNFSVDNANKKLKVSLKVSAK